MVAAHPSTPYFRNIYDTVRTILIGMRVTLKYCFARTVTVQYPDMAPVIQPRYRGFHWWEAQKCIACDACARACPIDCIYIEKSGPRKMLKETGIAAGGAIERYAIDYSKCLFCGLCAAPCPTSCLHMGDNHDLSAYTRSEMVVEFTELALQGKQTPEPYWMQKARIPTWAAEQKARWERRAEPVREAMRKALEVTEIPKKEPPAAKAEAAADRTSKDKAIKDKAAEDS
ncbi:MAG: NADH-quinone oxidoreductase subunit I [Phycisphaerae bacterium]|nr:NADH-quinone oxidoreductase subunit I [Phycisphaerae bacterium]